MSLRDVELKDEYRSPGDNMIQEFYIPVLRESNCYKRSVGFFSSSALIDLSKGITQLIKNGGMIQLIASPYLSGEDIEAVRKGYAERDARIEAALERRLYEHEDYFSSERLNLLANLIADGKMEIQIAFMENKSGIGMYHEKMGIFSDSDGNKVAFSGSMNESNSAFVENYETTDVFLSWEDKKHCRLKETAFERFWKNQDPVVKVKRFPQIEQRIIDMYKKGPANMNIDDMQFPASFRKHYQDERPVGARIPADVILYPYQEEAIQKWADENYRGIFDMATGTGKTLTSLGGIAHLSEFLDDELAVFILCPYQHLIDQWVEDIVRFNIEPIIAYGASKQKDWRERLKRAVRDQKLRSDKRFFCVICTNATFRKKDIQEQLKRIKSPILLVADEAHNVGAASFKGLLNDRYDYRLALSATLDRHMDPEGTSALYDFFGRPCIHYGIKQAIKENKLTPYIYRPILVSLNEEELDEYNRLSSQIAKCIKKGKNGKQTLTEKGKMLAIQRSWIVAGAADKIDKLRECIKPYADKDNLLIYCGATSLLADDADMSDVTDDAVRQIDAVTHMLVHDYDITCSQFTANENMERRTLIKEKFQKGDIQAIVAIKCLDEGVNIPGIRTAFILASTTNPKEYIQRRGRVLRKAPGKEIAEIFDFVTLPRPLDDVAYLPKEVISGDLTLVKNELRRMKEFSDTAKLSIDAADLMWEIQEAYHLTDKDVFQKEGDEL